jgi:hypothetical protein
MGLSRSFADMITPTSMTYDAAQAQATDLRRVQRMPRSTRQRSAGASRRASLARRVRLSLRLA